MFKTAVKLLSRKMLPSPPFPLRISNLGRKGGSKEGIVNGILFLNRYIKMTFFTLKRVMPVGAIAGEVKSLLMGELLLRHVILVACNLILLASQAP